MLTTLKLHQDKLYAVLIGLFFTLFLHFKLSYSLMPILLAVAGIGLLISQRKTKKQPLDSQIKWLMWAFGNYFLLFVLSLIVHKGKMSELDLPSRLLLALPMLILCVKRAIPALWVIYGILSAGIIAGLVAIFQVFGLGIDKPFPKIMHIQAGDIAMSFAMFAFAILFYFHAQKQRMLMLISLFAGFVAMIASFLTGARGAWIGVPVILWGIFWLNRQLLSKKLVVGVMLIVLAGGIFASSTLYHRYQEAKSDISLYVDGKQKSTSIGARFDMWKSAILGIEEKPLFGWGLQGVKEMRQQHFSEGKISKFAAQFDHAHNQYLQDASARGVLGLLGLLGILLVPLAIFWRNLTACPPHSLAHLWGVLGITHILMTMSYFLSQSFISHHSGMMFYFTTLVILLGLQKNAQNLPLTNRERA